MIFEETKAVKLSVCIIAHNEQATIARAIESVIGWAAEIVVIDCESNDATADVVAQHGIEPHRMANIRFSEANKNAAFAVATGEWILALDPDEVITPELRREITQLIERNPHENGFLIPRRNFYFGTPLSHGGAWPDRQMRLFRRGRGAYPENAYHVQIVIDGSTGLLRNHFEHHPYPTFDVWLRKFDLYTDYGAHALDRRGISITTRTIRHEMIWRPLRRWLERIFVKRGIRDGVPGVLAATFDLMTNVVSFGRYWMRRSHDS